MEFKLAPALIRQAFSRFVLLLLILFGIVFIVATLQTRDNERILAQGAQTTGTVMDKRSETRLITRPSGRTTTSQPVTFYILVHDYTAADQHYIAETVVSASYYDTYAVGSRLTVYYDPALPTQPVLEPATEFLASKWLQLISVLCGGSLALVLVIVNFAWKTPPEKEKRENLSD